RRAAWDRGPPRRRHRGRRAGAARRPRADDDAAGAHHPARRGRPRRPPRPARAPRSPSGDGDRRAAPLAETARPRQARATIAKDAIDMTSPPPSPGNALARQKARLLELLTKLSFERRPVTLSSGKPSDFYIDVKQTALSAEGHFLIGQLVLAEIETHAP